MRKGGGRGRAGGAAGAAVPLTSADELGVAVGAGGSQGAC